jgi:hypothetical protein
VAGLDEKDYHLAVSEFHPEPSEIEETRVETVVAALIYLMSHYARSGCPRLAQFVSGHLQCLAVHPDAPPVLRDMCSSLHGAWSRVAEASQGSHQVLH